MRSFGGRAPVSLFGGTPGAGVYRGLGMALGRPRGHEGGARAGPLRSYKSCRRILISGVWAVRVVDYMFRAPREFGVGRFPDGLAVAPARLQHAVRRLPRISTVMLDALPR